MNRAIAAALVLVLGGALAWMLLRKPEDPVEPAEAAATAREKTQPSSTPEAGELPPVGRVAQKRRVTKAEREAFRRRIAEGVARRKAQRERGEPAKDEPAEAPEDDGEGEDEDEGEPSEGIKDRTDGKFGSLVGAINEDFLPLAQECYEQALETDPELRGMLDMNFDIIADEEIGGIVDAVELGEENEIANAGMHECIRETMLSTIFPPPPDSGSTGVRLTLRFEPEPPSE